MAETLFSRVAVALLAFALCIVPALEQGDASAQSTAPRKKVREFEEIKQRATLSTDPDVNAAVECVVYSILSVLDPADANEDWELVVIDTAQVNAFAMPGGKIAVYTGIFGVATNQDALAAVVGHEIAHVTRNHVAKRTFQRILSQIGVGAATIVGGATGGYAGARSANTAASLGTQLGLDQPFSRSAETEADTVGMMYMAKAGFDPRSTIDLWRRMSGNGGGAVPEWLSDHPSDETRTANLTQHLPDAIELYNEAKAAGRNPKCE